MSSLSEKHLDTKNVDTETRAVENDEIQSDSDVPATGCSFQDIPEGYYTSKLFLGTYFAQVFAAIGGSGAFGLVAPLLTSINLDIGPDPDYVWVGYVYTLGLACCLTLVGRVSDIFGRRHVIVGGQILAMIGAIIASQAVNIKMLIIAQTLLAIAASTQMAFEAVLGELVPVGKRFLIMSSIFACQLPTSGFGTTLGLMFQLHTPVGWRGVYYTLFAVDTIAALLFYFFYYPPTYSDMSGTKTKKQAIKDFDFIGLILFSGGLFIFLMGLAWGGTVYNWSSAKVIVPMVLGIVTLVVFLTYEWKAQLPAPYMPLHLFRNGRWVCMVVCVSIGAMQFYALTITWPVMISQVWPTTGDDFAWLASAVSGSLIFGQSSGAVLANFISPKLILLTGTIVGTALVGGAACGNEFNQSTVIALIVIGFLLIGLQEAICGVSCTIALKDQREIGIGGGLSATIRSAVSSVGSVVYRSVQTNTLTSQITSHVVPTAIGAGLPATSIPSLMELFAGEVEASDVKGLNSKILVEVTHVYRAAASVAFRNVMLTAMAFGFVSICCAFFAPKLDEKKKNLVTRTLHKGQRSRSED